MKLVHKITLWIIGSIMLTTPLCMYISYQNMKQRIDEVEIVRLKEVNNMIAGQLQQGVSTKIYAHNKFIRIAGFLGNLPEERAQVMKGNHYNPRLHQEEYYLSVSSFYDVNGIHYKITSYNNVTTSQNILSSLLDVQLWKWVSLLIALSVTAGLISKFMFKPFRQNIDAMRLFNVRQKGKLKLADTSTKEFKELNQFLEKMTDKVREDYALMKQFSENASHELQTPLAVLRSKLELLTETEITEQQAFFMEDMQNAVDKLSRIHRSLTMLTRLENQEFEASHHVRFCKILDELLSLYEDTIGMQHIEVTKNVESDIAIKMHPALSEMLVSNLVSNAIRHNIDGGFIHIQVTRHCFTIRNSGLAPETLTEELFQRFKKGSSSIHGTGLGLAIVKQICEVNSFKIDYHYLDGVHTVAVHFPPNPDIIKIVEATEMQHGQAIPV